MAEKSPPGPRSALEQFAAIADRVRDRRLALFLDYDGTLTPIVRRPQDATLSDAMRQLLARLAQRCSVAIVSGRDRLNVESMVALDQLAYAGSHGFDIRGPGGLEMQHQAAQQALGELDEAERELGASLGEIFGTRVERKKFAIAVHYRELNSAADAERVEAVVDAARDRHPALRKRGGKKIFELLPDVAWDKGQAVLWIADALGLSSAGPATLYLGDDVTDEDVFAVLRRRGAGIGIRVGTHGSDTQAHYLLRDCDEAARFLNSLASVLERGDRMGR